MRQFDINVLVRILTDDDQGQGRRAAWLLPIGYGWHGRSCSSWNRCREAGSVGRPGSPSGLALPSYHWNIGVEDEPAVRQAMEWGEAGMDLADGLHMASGGQGMHLRHLRYHPAARGEKMGAAKFSVPWDDAEFIETRVLIDD